MRLDFASFKLQWPGHQFLRIGLAVCAVVCTVATVWACGPGFKQLLIDREAALNSHITIDFAQDVGQLFVPSDHKLPVNPHDADDGPGSEVERARVEGKGLSDWQRYKLQVMRRATSGDQAYALGVGLPEAIRLYTAGAVDFEQDDAAPCGESLVIANSGLARDPAPGRADRRNLKPLTKRFEAVLKLTSYQQASRASWAAFSMGRLLARHCRFRESAQWFQRTRQLVAQGMPDPLQLGVVSLGEEARVQWLSGKLNRAVALYAEQAGRGSRRGGNSLRHVAAYLLQRPSLLRVWLSDPSVQKVMTRYALSEADAAAYAARTQSGHAKVAAGVMPQNGREPLSTGDGVLRLMDQLKHVPAGQLVEPDALAALALSLGRLPEARQLAPQRESALAHWVQAKLALRDGQPSVAAQHYASAVKLLQQASTPLPGGSAFETEEGPGGNLQQVLLGEQAFLTLSRGDFVQALDQLYAVGHVYWLDLAYVAERVLTVDELKAYVDAHVPAPALPRTEWRGGQQWVVNEPDVAWPAQNVAAQLRTLLARRLMRAQRYDEALAYFHADGDLRFGDPHAKAHARDYVHALHAAPRAWTRLGRAYDLYTAARMMRLHGLDIVGYELGPDGAGVNGDYPVESPLPAPASLSTAQELQRVEQSGPSQAVRFHYRPVAARLAQEAAASLPMRSQAYAAAMCKAASWRLSVGDQAGAWLVYQDYTRHGPYVEWASHFGRDCPEPSFTSAAWYQVRTTWRQLRLSVRQLLHKNIET